MNKFLKGASITLIASMILGSASFMGLKVANAEESSLIKSNNIKLGEKYSNPKLEQLKELTYVLDAKDNKDVNGDKENDMVLVLGTKSEEGFMYMEELNVVVQDGKTKKYSMESLKNGGYDAKLFIGDFNKDKIDDMMVTSPNGGSGGTSSISILSFANNKFNNVLDQEISNGLQFDGKFVDGFKAEANCKDINKKFNIDLSASKDYYIEQGVYDKDGKALKDITIWTDGLTKIKPIDWNCDGNYELLCGQRICGYCHADTISNIESLYSFDQSKWNVKRLSFSTYLVED